MIREVVLRQRFIEDLEYGKTKQGTATSNGKKEKKLKLGYSLTSVDEKLDKW